jgi:hypothetical protein
MLASVVGGTLPSSARKDRRLLLRHARQVLLPTNIISRAKNYLLELNGDFVRRPPLPTAAALARRLPRHC